MAEIVTLTLNPTIDRSTEVDRVVPERKLRCTEPRDEPGGGGLNVARAVARLGGMALAVYAVGGPAGERLKQLVDAESLEHRPLPIEAETRQNLIVRDTSTDQQYRFGMPGARLSEAEIEQCLQTLRDAVVPGGYLVASGSLPPGVSEDSYARLAEELPEARLIVDTSGPALRHAVEAGVYLIKPNLRELGELTGRSLEGREQVRDTARRLIEEHGVSVVVVSLGGGGAMLVSAHEAEYVPSPTVPVRSRVGAGDSMVAGLTLALARDQPMHEAVRFGVAAGAAAVMTPGTELCRRDDTQRLYEQLAASAH